MPANTVVLQHVVLNCLLAWLHGETVGIHVTFDFVLKKVFRAGGVGRHLELFP